MVLNADTLFILMILHRSIRRYKAIKMITLPSRARALMSSPLLADFTDKGHGNACQRPQHQISPAIHLNKAWQQDVRGRKPIRHV